MTFQKGNPGRPRGAKGKKQQLLESHSKKLLQKLIELALDGDPTALRLCIDRLLPRLRPESAPVSIKTKAKDLASQGEAIVQAALTGALPPDVTRDLTAALADVARLKEFTEIEERLAALERGKPVTPWENQKDEPELLPIRGKRRRAK